MKLGLVCGFILLSSVANARVFDFGKERFGSILRGTYMPAVPGDLPYSNSSGNNVSFSDRYAYSPSYEFGVIFASKRVNTRLSFEIIQPTEKKGFSGNNAAGTSLYVMNSVVSVYMPKLGLEMNMWQGPESRVVLGVEAGTAALTLQNSYYAFTAAGLSAFPGKVDFREELKSTALAYGASLGWEMLLSDTTTISLDIGYRVLEFLALSHNVPVTTFQGAVVKGDAALGNDGAARTLSMTGYTAGVSFRFWIF